MPALPEKQQPDPISNLAALDWPPDARKREADLIAALAASRPQVIALLQTLRGPAA
jgi:hypothetical protein